MCLGIPMRVDAIDGLTARCSARGVGREVSLLLLEEELPRIGDHVLVHVGYALQTLTQVEARSTWELLDAMAAAGEAPGDA